MPSSYFRMDRSINVRLCRVTPHCSNSFPMRTCTLSATAKRFTYRVKRSSTARGLIGMRFELSLMAAPRQFPTLIGKTAKRRVLPGVSAPGSRPAGEAHDYSRGDNYKPQFLTLNTLAVWSYEFSSNYDYGFAT